MPQRPDVADQQVVELLHGAYALPVRRVEFLGLGADARAAAYRVHCLHTAYFLKVRADGPSPGVSVARFLADAGQTEVLAPIRARDGRLSTRVGDYSATLYPYVEGHNGFERPLTEDQWTHLGRTVRAVHDVELPTPLRDSISVEAYAPTWRNNVRVRLATGVPRGDGDTVTRQLAELLDRESEAITSILEHAETLAAVVRATPPAVVPCHGDLHAGNVLTQGTGTLTIVDWDHPVLAPKERDLMFVGAGIGGAWNRPEEIAAFYRGYGLMALNTTALAYYRCERIVEDIATYTDDLLQHVHRGADRTVALRKLASAFDANNVVEIAERTVAQR